MHQRHDFEKQAELESESDIDRLIITKGIDGSSPLNFPEKLIPEGYMNPGSYQFSEARGYIQSGI
jgi:hypothetical protein